MHVRRSRSKTPPAEALYLGWGHFQHPPGTVWGGLPCVAITTACIGRSKPAAAGGGQRIRSAQQHLGITIKFEEIWIIESSCHCDTFGFVRELYAERKRLGD